jgi:hypothetical protein
VVFDDMTALKTGREVVDDLDLVSGRRNPQYEPR